MRYPTMDDWELARDAQPPISAEEVRAFVQECQGPKSPWYGHEPQVTPPRPEPCTLKDAHAIFQRWLGDGYDQDALIAVLAAAAVERLDGDPLWLLVVSGSGNAKTETVQALTGAGAV